MNITINSVSETIKANMINALDMIEVTTDLDRDDIANEILRIAEENQWDMHEVIYYSEGWEIVSGNEFNAYEEEVDLSGCESALDAVMREANQTMSNFSRSVASEIADELADEIATLIEEATDRDYDGKITISNGSVYGWAVHQSETRDGVCIYENLEGEEGLTAVEYGIGDCFYASACFHA
ncbi:hypothetical protein [Vibrio diabolicus]|uniref:hypothetical protein n=1 Tax=Vibrio diabolicus TaxID=50719 RepID=UPI003753162B